MERELIVMKRGLENVPEGNTEKQKDKIYGKRLRQSKNV